MSQAGKNKGNKHAVLKPGQRARVAFTASLSGDRLLHFIKYMKVTSCDESEPTDEQIADFARQMMEEWIDQLQV